jgi:hypothetical protein
VQRHLQALQKMDLKMQPHVLPNDTCIQGKPLSMARTIMTDTLGIDDLVLSLNQANLLEAERNTTVLQTPKIGTLLNTPKYKAPP